MESDATGAPAKNRPFGRILFGVVAVVALVALGRQFGSLLDQFVVWVEGLGAIGPLVFMFGYAAATVAFVPGAVLSLAAGATFGLGSGRRVRDDSAQRPARRSRSCWRATWPARRSSSASRATPALRR